ncbi:MAG: type II toxin-antitoxin system PemK/MazF family toxin [Deltaproteobacteria bacterium]
MVAPKVAQGDVYWYDFAEPRGSQPGFERPVAILQGDALNRSTIQTAVVIVLTSNLRAEAAAGNVLLKKKDTGLDRDSVANVSQLATIDRGFLRNHSGRLPPSKIQAILRGVDTMLGRES